MPEMIDVLNGHLETLSVEMIYSQNADFFYLEIHSIETILDRLGAGNFHIYSTNTIDEGIELLTGVKAGTIQPDGSFENDEMQLELKFRDERELARQVEKIFQKIQIVL